MTDSVTNLALERARRGLGPVPDPLALLTVGGRIEFGCGASGYVDAIERDASGAIVAVTVMVLGRRVRMTPDAFVPPSQAAGARRGS